MPITRRDLLASAAALAVTRPAWPIAQGSKPLRVGHMTDFHAQPEMGAEPGVRKAIAHLMGQSPKPDLVVTGGDLIMDAFAAREDRTKTQWEVFTRLVKEGIDVPIKHTIGNHDVWGWNKAQSRTTGDEPLWGKQWFLDLFEYEKTYQSFVMGGWKFVILDTVFETPDGYNGLVEEEQLEWLKREVETELPTVVFSHIPLFAPCTMVYRYDSKTGDWRVGGSLMTKNFNEIKTVFDKRKNVKLCVSGHIHLQDRYDYNGVSYLCAGAVCGAWWLGKHRDFMPAYTVIDLWPDGTWKHEYIEWGWQPPS
ncbi:MAG: metallophosphoesterase [Fimbriimonadaceae bacterium]|nr:metallophosphoesterase [Fimbriimonadaceae bacterium]QYK57662.1 MAG: metallophosphoesterase [Fimbriimonadaceae bacterium]